MGWADSYSITDSTSASQSWARSSIGTDAVRYVNDTARAAGIEEYFELRRSRFSKGTGASAVPGGRWNFFHSVRTLATESVPTTVSFTFSAPDSVINVVATARTRWKNSKLILVTLGDSDAEIDQSTAGRVI
jgi:hypothetical protein